MNGTIFPVPFVTRPYRSPHVSHLTHITSPRHFAATHPISCEQHFMISRGGRRDLIHLDVDGSGPLPSFPVTCYLTPEGQVGRGE